jgi:maltose O-acetyltransferase
MRSSRVSTSGLPQARIEVGSSRQRSADSRIRLGTARLHRRLAQQFSQDGDVVTSLPGRDCRHEGVPDGGHNAHVDARIPAGAKDEQIDAAEVSVHRRLWVAVIALCDALAGLGDRVGDESRDVPDNPDSRSMRERMLSGDLYIADDPELGELKSAALDLAASYNATSVRQPALRRCLLEELLGSIGEDSEIRPPLYVDYGSHIRIGARCFVNFGLMAIDVAAITIGDDVQIGPNVQLLTPTHPVEPEPRRQKWEAARPISIADNVWLGGGAIVLPGVTIGENSVVGAGAVVTRDLPANVVAAGNPARVIRALDEAPHRDPEMS